jgi:hypothetical protein
VSFKISSSRASNKLPQLVIYLLTSTVLWCWLQIWELGLDTTRNRIIQMDVLFSLGTLSISV